MARNTFIASINLQELKETYCELGRLSGCDCCIAVRAYNNTGDKYSTSVAYVETSPFKATKEVAEDIERTYNKLASFVHAPHYKAMVLDLETFEELAVVATI
jgi:hypothetical protein